MEMETDSNWLIQARRAAASRDILDALRDAEILASELREKWKAISGQR